MPLTVRIGFYLAVRQLRRASLWTTGLIIFVMVLTFLNLVVVSGILVGLIEGSVNDHRFHYTSDVILTTLDNKSYIEHSTDIISIIKSLPEVAAYSARYTAGATLEANYKTRKDTDKPNTNPVTLAGIDPVAEDKLTGLKQYIVEGAYLAPSDYDQILLGSILLKRYQQFDIPGFEGLRDVVPGTKIRVKIGDVVREVTVKGILKSKVDNINQGAYMVDTQMRALIGRSDLNVGEIAIELKPGDDPVAVKSELLARGADQYSKVQTYEDAQPKFLKDIEATFALLGNMFSSIGLVVASITIFIVIFINAITRRKYIGILKGIGIRGRAIEFSYVFQSLFYALLGSLIGLFLVYVVLVPLFHAHPIDFPFSDGILVAPLSTTLIRVVLLVGTTVIAGFIPAWMIIRKNTLDSILGRN